MTEILCFLVVPAGATAKSTLQAVSNDQGEMSYNCLRCEKPFESSAALKFHLLHDKHIKCVTCKKYFGDVSPYLNHGCFKKGRRPRVCQYCGKVFARADNLTRHIRLHTGEKPYECSLCGKKYSDASALKHHINQHKTLGYTVS